MSSHVLPDDIRRIEDRSMDEKISTIYSYIRYMREQIDFWGANRSAEIDNASQMLKDLAFEVHDGALYITTTKGGTL